MFCQRKCPSGTNKIMTMVESGLGTDEIALALTEMAEMENLDGEKARKKENFPDEIRIIAQALAFREAATEADFVSILAVLAMAYSAETFGLESFRSGDSISSQNLNDLRKDQSYYWLVCECPNGQGVEADGAILGACCFSTDGISRRNGQ
jgi:hypothetical protein